MDILRKYFSLSDEQEKQFAALHEIYSLWNARINVISRKDMDNLYERHVLHSLGIAKVITFRDKSSILDVGTGGGFPGIPLAIMFAKCNFVLVDSIGKKITVVNAVAEALGLKNIEALHLRAEAVNGKFDFVVSRAVTKLDEFYPWVKHKISPVSFNDLPNGILYLKGGEVEQELILLNNKQEEVRQLLDRKPLKIKNRQSTVSSQKMALKNEVYELKNFFEEEFFETKKVLHLFTSK